VIATTSTPAQQRTAEERNTQCAAHTAVTDEQKCSRPFIAAIIRIATGDASIADPASVPKKGQCAGAAWSEDGLDRAHRGTDGRSIELLRYTETVKWNPAEWISNSVAFDAT